MGDEQPPPESLSAGRREFLCKACYGLCGILGAGVAVPGALHLLAPPPAAGEAPWIGVGPMDVIPRGQTVVIEYLTARPQGWRSMRQVRRAAIRRVGDRVEAISLVCTHLNCWTSYDSRSKRFLCPCHGGVFDEEGRVVSGPPPAPLARLETKVDQGKLYLRESS